MDKLKDALSCENLIYGNNVTVQIIDFVYYYIIHVKIWLNKMKLKVES